MPRRPYRIYGPTVSKGVFSSLLQPSNHSKTYRSTMISDEPDEDADTLDDEDLLGTYVGAGPPKRQSGSPNTADVQEWPQSPEAPGAGSDIDAATLAWF